MAKYKQKACATLGPAFRIVSSRNRPKVMRNGANCEKACSQTRGCRGYGFLKGVGACYLHGRLDDRRNRHLGPYEIAAPGTKIRAPPLKMCGKQAFMCQYNPRTHRHTECLAREQPARGARSRERAVAARQQRFATRLARSGMPGTSKIFGLHADDSEPSAINMEGPETSVLKCARKECGAAHPKAQCWVKRSGNGGR